MIYVPYFSHFPILSCLSFYKGGGDERTKRGKPPSPIIRIAPNIKNFAALSRGTGKCKIKVIDIVYYID